MNTEKKERQKKKKEDLKKEYKAVVAEFVKAPSKEENDEEIIETEKALGQKIETRKPDFNFNSVESVSDLPLEKPNTLADHENVCDMNKEEFEQFFNQIISNFNSKPKS